MYHGIGRDINTPINGRHLAIEQFEKQLLYFRKNFDIVSLADLCETRLRRIQPQKHTIALTFDDGYLNNISNALPLLRKYKIPATFFISTASLEEPDYIHPSDYLDLVNFFISDKIEINGKIFKRGKYHLVEASDQKLNIHQYINSLRPSMWEKTFSDLRIKYPNEVITNGVDPQMYKLISLSEMAGIGSELLISIGSHGHQHINLIQLTEDEIEHQLSSSKKILERYATVVDNSLAYPYGIYNRKVLSISRKIGFRYLIAGGDVEPENRHEVFPRVGVLNLGSYAFNILSINRSFKRFGF